MKMMVKNVLCDQMLMCKEQLGETVVVIDFTVEVEGLKMMSNSISHLRRGVGRHNS